MIKPRRPWLLCVNALALAWLLPAGADAKALIHAEDRLDTPAFKDCMSQATATADQQGCLSDEMGKQDKLLNDTYKAVMDSLASDARKTRLRDGEREWIKRTKSKCDSAAKAHAGGSIAPILIAQCNLSETEARTLYLRKLAPSAALPPSL